MKASADVRITRKCRMTRRRRVCRFAVVALAWAGATLVPLAARANITAASATDVCPDSDNPCNVTTQIDVVANSTLDFGTRDVTVSGGGRFYFGAGSGAIKCGNFTANPSGGNFSIKAVGLGAVANTTASGSVEVAARRGCSTMSRPCLKDAECQLGPCDTRRCSLRQSRSCTGDSDCQFGTCLNTHRCSLNNQIRCTSNDQCNLGTCPAQLTCKGESVNPINCTTDAQCEFGVCSVGSGSIDINGPIVGNSDAPATVSLNAANAITIRKLINLDSTALEGDGGELEMTTTSGDIQVLSSASIVVTGGGLAAGGAVGVVAGGSLTLNGEIQCMGGDYDGGAIDLAAGVDVNITKDINCSAVSGAGYGGEILIDAGRDLLVSGTSTLNRTDFFTEGHTDAFDSAGDGGTQELTAGRDLELRTFTTCQGSGSAPDGSGSDVYFTAGRNFLLNGLIQSKSAGLQGTGGYVQVSSGGGAQVQSSGVFELLGGSGGGGSLELLSGGAVTFSGGADASAASQGPGGSVSLSSDADVGLTGSLSTNGGSGGGDGELQVDACRINVGPTGLLDNKALLGINRFRVHESMNLQAGSRLLSAGSNVLIYRTLAKPQPRNGTITPAPQIVVDSKLVGCPVCGNGEVDQTETCDDGNTNSGDGCSSACQNENCIAQTPGYPAVPLCSDGDDCTIDTCNAALNGGQCQHQQGCDDGISCTTDACVESKCVYTPVDASCIDGNPCTNDICSAQTGCSNVANNVACDDGKFCTQGDHCSNKICIGGGATNCSDGVACTADGCNETSDQCTHQTNDALCANGVFCDGAEICDAVTGCGAGTVVNCSGLDGQCVTGVCNEAQDSCTTQPANESGSCDDGNFCTVNDRCQSGVCVGDPRDCGDDLACTVDACDEGTDECTHQTSDQLCSNGVFCDGPEICNAVSGCGAGTPVNCSALDGECVTGICNEEQDACGTQPANESGACDDGNFCTVTDHCQAGVCVGDQRDCADSVSCTIDACDEGTDKCTHQTSDDLCSNGAFCDGAEVCNEVSGCGAGTPVNCSGLDGQCVTGVCNEEQDACTTQPANESGACDDGNFCTVGDNCQSGVCAGGQRDCGDSVSCTVDGCNEALDKCTHQASDASCSNGVFCDGAEICNALSGCDAGIPVDCSGLDGQCVTGVCNEAQDACTAQDNPPDTVCDDGDACTSGDKCNVGVCQGVPIQGCGGVCGDAVVNNGEECDDGNTVFVQGEYCGADCLLVPCGRPTDSPGPDPLAGDALFALRTSVGLVICDPRVCDTDASQSITAGDALMILRASVGQAVTFNCPLS